MASYTRAYPFADVTYDGAKEMFKVTTLPDASGGDPSEVNLYPRRLFSIQIKVRNIPLAGTSSYKKVLTVYLVNNANGKNIAKLGTVEIADTNDGDTVAKVDVNGAQTPDGIIAACEALTIN